MAKSCFSDKALSSSSSRRDCALKDCLMFLLWGKFTVSLVNEVLGTLLTVKIDRLGRLVCLD